MKRLFKTAILIQALLTGVYTLLLIYTTSTFRISWLSVLSSMLFIVAMLIFGIITIHMNNNDLFKNIDQLEKERKAYKEAKIKYLNTKINEVELE